VTLFLQDLRDVEGDAAAGRTTMTSALGEQNARVVIAFLLISTPLVTHVLLREAPWEWAIQLGLGSLNVVCAARVLIYEAPASHALSYRLHTLWFSLIVLAACLPQQLSVGL
jgi:1,4-dihydroxy-2-naphthoate octaprenyltransferase